MVKHEKTFRVKLETTDPLVRYFFVIKTRYGDFLIKLGVSGRFQPAIYTVVREESEYEVQYIENPPGKPQNLDIIFSNFYF